MTYKIKRRIALFMLPFMLITSISPLVAEDAQIGFTTYYFSDSGGNSVATNSFNLAKKFLSKTVLLLDLEVDNVTVPPITAVTGATRPKRQSSKEFTKTRGQAIVGLEQGIGPNSSLALTYYRSQEVDYTSNSAIGTWTQEMFQKNTTLSFRGQFISDKVGTLQEDGTVTNQDKYSFWGVVSLDQLLSPTTILSMNYNRLYQDGFLSDPYRTVKVFDENNAFISVTEKHPDNRLRQSISAKMKQSIPTVGAAVTGSIRYYFDDWDMSSRTIDLQFSKYVLDDLIARFNYRYYSQDQASFASDRYVGTEFENNAFRTADYKLQSFFSNNFGISTTLMFRKLAKSNRDFRFLKDSSVELRYFRYFNSLDFSANIYQLNIDFGI